MDFWVVDTDYSNFGIIYGCDMVAGDGTCEKYRVHILVRPSHYPSLQTFAKVARILVALRKACIDVQDITAIFDKCKKKNSCNPLCQAHCKFQNMYSSFEA